jgi:hypothetical protein
MTIGPSLYKNAGCDALQGRTAVVGPLIKSLKLNVE